MSGRGGAPVSDVPDRERPDQDKPDQDMPDQDAPLRAHGPEEADGSAGSAESNRQTALSIREAAARTGRSEAAIYRLIATRQLRAQPTASHGLNIHLKDLERLERRGRRFGWLAQSVWEWMWQRGQMTVRRLKAGISFLAPRKPPDYPSPPWYWIMPWALLWVGR
jgi:hypothetical protein